MRQFNSVEKLDTDIKVRIGEIVVAEIGTVVDRFPDEAHLCRLRGSVSSREDQCEQTAEHQDRQREPRTSPSPH